MLHFLFLSYYPNRSLGLKGTSADLWWRASVFHAPMTSCGIVLGDKNVSVSTGFCFQTVTHIVGASSVINKVSILAKVDAGELFGRIGGLGCRALGLPLQQH